jgi:type 1 glutamine amidotransferase
MKLNFRITRRAALLAAVSITAAAYAAGAPKNIVLIAGRPSHPPGEHEHNAGVLLFEKCLASVPGVKVTHHLSGEWPAQDEFDGAAAVLIYSDGGGGHPALQGDRLQQLDALIKKGVGFGVVHYACEPTKEKGQKEFLDWIGGCFEINWSVNPHWEAEFKELPDHPVTRGVKPFKMNDEWYFHMRFREGMKGVKGILTAVAPESTMSRPDGAHSGNPAAREAVKRGEAQHMMWVCERSDGGRGFGFTGGHFHKNWGQDDFRKVVLNAILWIAKVEVPAGGVQSTVTEDDLKANLDSKPPRKPRPAKGGKK